MPGFISSASNIAVEKSLRFKTDLNIFNSVICIHLDIDYS